MLANHIFKRRSAFLVDMVTHHQKHVVIVIDDLFDPLQHLVEKRIGIRALIGVIGIKTNCKGLIKGQPTRNGVGNIVVFLHDSFDFLPRLLGNVGASVNNPGYRRFVHSRQIGDLLNRNFRHL
ncbi:hypothetical protein D3C78_1604070 [compost metagenome]